jgi:hypothetical protein
MLGSVVLDVAIGLIFVYLLVSLVVTAMTEMLSGLLKWRSKNLWAGIRNLLDTGQDREWVDRLYSHPLIQGLSEPGKEDKTAPTGDRPPRSAPSYIPSRTFAVTLLEILKEPGQTQEPLQDTIAKLQNEKLRGTLLALLGESRGNVEELKKNVEIWFNNSMERVSGWYKRRTQLWNLTIAMFTVLLVNADTLVIVQALADNEAMRTALVAQAQAYAEANQAEDQTAAPSGDSSVPATDASSDENVAALQSQTEELQRLLNQIEGLNLPIGWDPNAAEDDPYYRGIPSSMSRLGETVAFHLLGWIVSIFAVSLGAPFWFDMLNRVISIRSAGRAPEEKPKSPETVPAPREPGNIPVTTGPSGTSVPAEQRLVIEVRGAGSATGG